MGTDPPDSGSPGYGIKAEDAMMTTHVQTMGLPAAVVQAVTKVATLVETKVPLVMSPAPAPTP